MNYLGIDVGKFSHAACLIDETGRKKIFQIPSNKHGFEKFGKLVKSLKVDELLVGMEATGHYFLNIYDFLLGLGLSSENVAVLNPLQVKAFRNTNLRGAKSDDIDATRIAVLLRFGDFQRCNVAIDKLMNLRELTRLRSELVSNNGDIKRKIISVLDRIFPEFPTVFSNCFGKTAMYLITKYPTPEDLGSLSLTKLEKTIKRLSKRGISKGKIEKLHHLATNSIGIKLGVEAFKIELQILIARLKMCKEQITDLEKKISKIVSQFPNHIFSIPGVGVSTGATILAEIGDINNFKSSIKLIAFAGLDPKLKESGKYQGRTPISKRGSKYLRNAIWQSAMVAARVDPMFKKIYQDKRDKGKSHKYAVTATANKMAKVIYSVLKNNRSFKEQVP